MTDRVYIIESPSDDDLQVERTEGKALFESLKLADCDAIYRLVKTKKEFDFAIEFIVEDFFNKKGKFSAMPFIHISAHGDKGGIQLTSNELVPWSDFRTHLDKINTAIGFVPHFTNYSNNISRIVLCFSACKGFNAFKIWNKTNHCPYQSVIGPIVDVDWSDCLTAFITFYHLTNFKEKSFEEAVRQMNLSAGLIDDFKCFVSPEVGKKKSSV
jgi:hypothetical protein